MLKKITAKLFSIVLLLLCFSTLIFAQNTNTDNKYVYLYDPIMCTIKNYFTVQNISNRDLIEIEIRVLVGTNDSLYQTGLDLSVSPSPSKWEVDKLGNYYAVINVESLPAGKSLDIIISKVDINYGIVFDKSIYNIKDNYTDFLKSTNNKQYIMPSPGIESNNKLFINNVKNIDKALPVARRAYMIFSIVNEKMTLDTNKKYANTSALIGLQSWRGVCTEFAGVFVGLCRANGIPARIVSGYWPQNLLKTGFETTMTSDDRHSWAEFYLPNVGWIPVEPSDIVYQNNKRIVSSNGFASILASSRHYVYSYGLEQEKEGNIAINYSYLGNKTNNNLIKIGLTKETITVNNLKE